MNPILHWYGHSCFRLDFGQGGSVIFDPYAKGSVPGAELPKGLEADLVLCSHGHGDHNAADRVRLTGKKPGFAVRFLDTFHDPEGGRLRGTNRMAVVEYGGFRAAHLGDLGCPLTEEQKKILSGLDLLLVPVGGHFTIGPAEAKALTDELKPRITVPMHYRRGAMGFNVISALEEFTELLPGWRENGGPELTLTPDLAGVFVMSL